MYPMCVKANRGEYLVQMAKNEAPVIFSLSDMPE
jgi:hypothetical protein